MLKIVCRATRACQQIERKALRCGEGYKLGGSLSLPQYRTAVWGERRVRLFSSLARRRQDHEDYRKSLPLLCPGCGAFSQTVDPESAGYYAHNRAKRAQRRQADQEEDEVFRRAMEQPSTAAAALPEADQRDLSTETPICNRCHDLRHQSRGTSVIHPSIQSIQSIIEESPHKHNHIYHVLDAADFPMSLIPNLQHALDLPRLRTQNRRSKHIRFLRGRVAEVSFIITRSDLLAPQKEQVDKLMPYLQDVLRDALGRTDKKIRLGNVRCVSAKRGWWTKSVKEEIWEKGGAGWMVGKANVGKSALFEVVFPKGRGQDVDARVERLRQSEDISLLPPPQPETPYPTMPLVSSLPGTTASPIRIPFGSGKGELIDLPGVHRSSLEEHVQPQHHKNMVMKSRVTPEQLTIRPSQSLILGGVIRITPNLPDGVSNMLAYAFVPPAFEAHVTGTHKAIALQTGVHSALSQGREGEVYTGTVSSIATEEARSKIQSAGMFKLAWNVTKRRTGPLTDLAAGKQKADNLPFIVHSADILIESVGWVELVCQVRRRSQPQSADDALSALEAERDRQSLPEVEVFSPEGKFVGVRQPMNAWLLGGKKKMAEHRKRARSRMSISVVKRREGGRRGQAQEA